jgi:3-oxoacyl-(acyl-carrier-protein) synthase
MEYHLIHEKELSQRTAWAERIREIDRRSPPVGYERLLYPWFFIVPELNAYARLILNETDKLVIPLLPIDEAMYGALVDYGRASGLEMLLVDRYHDWLARRGLRLVPVGALQNIELAEFALQGTRRRKLRYLANRFASAGMARTVEYTASARPEPVAMIELMEAWGRAKNNVIWHSARCMEHLLRGELPAGHRAFLTTLDGRLCSVIVIEACGTKGWLMDQEFYDPATAPLGHMEFAIVAMMDQLKREGQDVLSFGATWYPFPFENHPQADAEGWAWIKKCQERPTLLGKIFEQGQSNYQFKKKFGVAGEPLFAYLAPGVPFPTILRYWSVFYENSLTPAQLGERLRKAAPSSPPSTPPAFDRPEERQAAWDRAERFEAIPYSAHPLDLMSDTWFGRESAAARARVDLLKARRATDSPGMLQEIFPFKHLIFTRQGRDAEALFYGQFSQAKRKILATIPWTSTLLRQLARGFEVVELPAPGALDPKSKEIFKGECDLEALRVHLESAASAVAMFCLEVLCNGTGGHPVRLSHVRQLKADLRARGIPLVMDAARVVRNAVLLRRYESGAQDRDVWRLVRDTLAEADYVVTSLTKDFAVPAGGLIATNDDALAARIREARVASGAVDGGGELLINQSLADQRTILALIEEQMALTQVLQDRLTESGIPFFGPAYGHAIVLDCEPYLAEPADKAAREKFLRELFIQTGIRAGIHQAGQQRQGWLARGLRLAFPLGLARAQADEIFDKLRAFLAARSQPAPALPLKTTIMGEPFPHAQVRKSESAESAPAENGDIAIIGLSGRFPGADNHYDFWAGLRRGENFVGEVPPERWNHQEYYVAGLPKAFVPHKTRCKYGAFLRSHDRFDAAFFNLSAAEVVMMDPQERLAMEVVWACVEDAGYTPAGLGREVGLFSGITYNEYQKLIPRPTHSCFLTSRLAYGFNFNGPAVALDTGCASSLAALDAACQNLRARRCRAAVAVGSNVVLHPDHYASLSQELSAATRPESVPFGDADGWIPAEGVVAVLLKPLADAARDRDHVYAVIKASALGQEGKSSWFSAISPRHQADFLRRSFARAGISPATISYVEAAANGSPLGDAIELEGLTAAFRDWTKQNQFCPIGTVKANAGHGEGVSTLLQLAKVLLQFKTGEIYPLLHPARRDPNLRLRETPFRFPVETEVWARPTFSHEGKQFAIPRRATISSFGGGGNMGHLILEEAPAIHDVPDSLDSYLIPLSAQTPEQLARMVAELVAFFDRIEALDANWAESYRMLSIMHTLCAGRSAFARRVAFVVADLDGLKDKCRRFPRHEADPDILVKTQDSSGGTGDLGLLLTTQAWRELGRRWVDGAEIPWGHFFTERQARRVPLPTYDFNRQRFEISEAAFLRACAAVDAPGPLPAQAPGARPGAADDDLAGVVKAAFAKVLAVAVDELDLTRPLDQYGFASAMVVSVAAELETHFQKVPPTRFFDCGTIGEVVEWLRSVSPATQMAKSESLGRIANPVAQRSGTTLNLDGLAEGILSQRLSPSQVLEQLG